jgi:hypothetical protein
MRGGSGSCPFVSKVGWLWGVFFWVHLEEFMTVVNIFRCGFRKVLLVHYMW